MAEDIRVGTGFDIHRLVEGVPLVLGGVTIPYEKDWRGTLTATPSHMQL